MAERLPLPEVRALVAALERARRHGAAPTEALAAQARDARFSLARRIREDAARAGPKIQLVVALLLVPSVLLLVAAALAAALLGQRNRAVTAASTALRFLPLQRLLRPPGPPARRPRPSLPPRPIPLSERRRAPRVRANARRPDGKVGEGVAEWERVGYGGRSNRPEWRGSSHSATPVTTLSGMTVGVSGPLRAHLGREEPAKHSGSVPRLLLRRRRSLQEPRALRGGLDPRHPRDDHRARPRRAQPDGLRVPQAVALLPGQLLRDRPRRLRAG